MKANWILRAVFLTSVGVISACQKSAPEKLLGTIEWDRISMPATASERVVQVFVVEGQMVKVGDPLLQLDDATWQTRIHAASAQLEQQQARLAALTFGARSEQIAAARAALARAVAARVEARKQFARQADLVSKHLVAAATMDTARAARDRSEADVNAANAQLLELTHGSRAEDVSAAQAAVKSAEAGLAEQQLNAGKLLLRAPRAGRVDALPFKLGDQPPIGANLVSLLVGEAPYARVFVPMSLRAHVHEGKRYALAVHGVTHDEIGVIRSIAAEPSFTPYYALTGDDASRLVYRAEILIQSSDAAKLAAGIPVEALPVRE
jgi:HlyD family secretion protein